MVSFSDYMRHQPPSDPCMCGSFDSWHPACYEGLRQKEIDARHKRFVSEWKRKHRAAALKKAMAA